MSSIYGRLPITGHYLRKRLRLAAPARSLAAFSLVLLAASIGIYRLGGIAPQALIGLLLLTAGFASLAFFVSAVGLLRVWLGGVEGGGTALGGLFLSSVVLAPFALTLYLAVTNPRANAAYTEGVAPDQIAAAIATARAPDAPISAAASAIAATESPSVVSGRRYVANPPQVYAAARKALIDSGWKVKDVVAGDPDAGNAGPAPGDLGVSGSQGIPVPTPRATIDAESSDLPLDRPDSDQYRISAVARDPVFALPSDVDIRIVGDGSETFVDMQSVSRTTGIDFGQNRRFIESFLADMDTQMAGQETLDAAPGR